tara:strand:- start:1471 stop:2526 length:1056 start_codon:yes stop_codon:yes gene_type:complete
VSRYRAGYDSRPDLVAPTVSQGVAQRLASGTTSATVTVSAATGGGGVYAYSAPAIDKPGGSGAAVSGTVPGALSVTGLADGESVVVSGTATDSGTGQLVSWSHVVAVAAAGGGGGGGGGWVEKLSLNIKGASTSGPHTSGDTTVDATGGDIDMTAKRVGNSGTVQVTNNVGATVTAIGGSGAMTAAWDLSSALTGYDFQYVRFYAVAVDVYLTGIDFDDNGSICNISLSDSVTWSDGDARGLEVYRATADEETRRVRGAGGTTVIGTQRAKVTERVVTLVMTRGQIVDMADTSGTTAPADPHTATLHTCGGDAVGRDNDTPLYLSNLYLLTTAFGGAALTVTDIKVRRYEA